MSPEIRKMWAIVNLLEGGGDSVLEVLQLERGVQVGEALGDDLVEKDRLIVEVPVEATGRDPDALGDEGHRDIRITPLHEQVACGEQDLLLAITRPASRLVLPSRRRGSRQGGIRSRCHARTLTSRPRAASREAAELRGASDSTTGTLQTVGDGAATAAVLMAAGRHDPEPADGMSIRSRSAATAGSLAKLDAPRPGSLSCYRETDASGRSG
jgi:hypothetical protein